MSENSSINPTVEAGNEPSGGSGEQQAFSDKKASGGPVNFVRAHPLWVLSLAPFFLAALKLLVVSFGNVEILRYLVQNLDPVQLILATAIPLIPVGAFWLIPIAFVYAFSPKGRQYTLKVRLLGLVIAIPVLVFFALQGIFLSLLANLVLFAVLLVLWMVSAGTSRYIPLQQLRFGAVSARQSMFVIYIVMLLASLTTVLSNWLPSETISLKGDVTPTVGYIVSGKEDWTVILTLSGDGRDIRIVPKAEVTSREACVYRSWTTRPFFEFVQSNPPIASCPGEKDWLARWLQQFQHDGEVKPSGGDANTPEEG